MPKVTTLNLYHINDNHLVLSADQDFGFLSYTSPGATPLPVHVNNLSVVSADGAHTRDDVALQLVNLETALGDETGRAQTAEGDLSTSVTDLQTTLQDALDDETERAQTAEGELSTSVTNLQTTLQDALDDETERAQTAEGELSTSVTNLQTTLQAALDGEIERAEAAEEALDLKIEHIISNADLTVLDSLTEVVTAFQAADSNLNNAISDLSTGLDGRLVTVENLLRSLFGQTDLTLL